MSKKTKPLSQADLDAATELLRRGIQHRQIGVSLWTGQDSRYGTVSHKIPKVVRCNGTVEINLSTEGFQDMFEVMWKGVVSEGSCEVTVKARNPR